MVVEHGKWNVEEDRQESPQQNEIAMAIKPHHLLHVEELGERSEQDHGTSDTTATMPINRPCLAKLRRTLIAASQQFVGAWDVAIVPSALSAGGCRDEAPVATHSWRRPREILCAMPTSERN